MECRGCETAFKFKDLNEHKCSNFFKERLAKVNDEREAFKEIALRLKLKLESVFKQV